MYRISSEECHWIGSHAVADVAVVKAEIGWAEVICKKSIKYHWRRLLQMCLQKRIISLVAKMSNVQCIIVQHAGK